MYRYPVILLALCLALLTVQDVQAEKSDLQSSYSVLVVGDSLSIPLGERLEEYFNLRPGIDFHRLGKVSSGLARPDFFNWESNLRFMANRHKPDAVFIMIGTNDTKNLTTPSGVTRTFGARGWQKEYMRRGQRLLDICRGANPAVSIFWIGAPVMGKSRLDNDVQVVNQALIKLCQGNPDCTYVDTREVLADAQGNFMSHRVDDDGTSIRLRAKDGVHVTKAGSLLLADRCLETAIFTSSRAPKSSPATRTTGKSIQRARTSEPVVQAAVAKAVIADNNTTNWFYSIQESSWMHFEEAARRARVLQHRGLPARVATVNLGARGIWHRVMIGSFRSLQRARQEKRDLHAIHKLEHALIMKMKSAA